MLIWGSLTFRSRLLTQRALPVFRAPLLVPPLTLAALTSLYDFVTIPAGHVYAPPEVAPWFDPLPLGSALVFYCAYSSLGSALKLVLFRFLERLNVLLERSRIFALCFQF
jgi:hypothetical protein